jgi:hypothetical protein
MCINFPITVRLLQNNERGFPLIFSITVVEYNTTQKLETENIHVVYYHLRFNRKIWNCRKFLLRVFPHLHRDVARLGKRFTKLNGYVRLMKQQRFVIMLMATVKKTPCVCGRRVLVMGVRNSRAGRNSKSKERFP